MSRFYDMARRRRKCREKLTRCVLFARECNQDWMGSGAKEFRRLRDEAMGDARYWKEEMLK